MFHFIEKILNGDFFRSSLLDNCEVPCSCSPVNSNYVLGSFSVTNVAECRLKCSENEDCQFYTYYSGNSNTGKPGSQINSNKIKRHIFSITANMSPIQPLRHDVWVQGMCDRTI